MTLKTVTTQAKAGTRSIRVTIPEGAVAYLGITAGDELEWSMESIGGRKVLIVEKAKPTESDTAKALRIASQYIEKEGKKR